MALTLADLKRTDKPKPPRILLYGSEGVGKTTIAAGAPNPVFLWMEDGAGKLDLPGWGPDQLKSSADVFDAIAALLGEDHDFKTLVVDTVDAFEELISVEIAKKNGWKNIADVDYGRGYAALEPIWKDYLSGLDALRDERGMTIIQIAHSEVKRFEDPQSAPYDRYQIALHKKAAAMMQEHQDVIGFINFRVSTVEAKLAYGGKVTRGASGGQRIINLEGRPAFTAKNRYSMPPTIELPTTPEAWKNPEQIYAAFAKELKLEN